ncbi:MAG: hypothetical protein QM680_12510 [Luteolibacter sp.]
MKPIHLILCGAAMLPLSARAQFIVNDPVAVAQSAVQHATELAEYVEMASNQVEQISLLTSQLNEAAAQTKALGDPASLLKITGADEVIGRLKLPSIGQLPGDLQKSASGSKSLTNTGDGLFRPIENISINGVEVPRNGELYRKYGALEETQSNYQAVREESDKRISGLKEDIGETTAALQAATTDAEVQKLQGTLASQNAELVSLQDEADRAATQVLVQDALNRNDAEKQAEARREQNAAEWGVINKELDKVLTIPNRNAL